MNPAFCTEPANYTAFGASPTGIVQFQPGRKMKGQKKNNCCYWEQSRADEYLRKHESYALHGSAVLPKFARASGLLWLVAHLTAFIMRPNSRLGN
jgi:hypothetical protein